MINVQQRFILNRRFDAIVGTTSEFYLKVGSNVPSVYKSTHAVVLFCDLRDTLANRAERPFAS
jgi:hypothetical protein